MVGYPIHSDPWWSKKNTSSLVPHTLGSHQTWFAGKPIIYFDWFPNLAAEEPTCPSDDQ